MNSLNTDSPGGMIGSPASGHYDPLRRKFSFVLFCTTLTSPTCRQYIRQVKFGTAWRREHVQTCYQLNPRGIWRKDITPSRREASLPTPRPLSCLHYDKSSLSRRNSIYQEYQIHLFTSSSTSRVYVIRKSQCRSPECPWFSRTCQYRSIRSLAHYSNSCGTALFSDGYAYVRHSPHPFCHLSLRIATV